MSLPSTITQTSNHEIINENNNENNESNIFSNNGNNNNENNGNENNRSTITQDSYNEENSNNENYPFGPLKNIPRKSRKMNTMIYAKTRKAQRGGSKIPGVSNVVRITGTTLKKIGNVGIYGLKKVGNGVHVITHVVNKSVTAVTGRNSKNRGKTAKKSKKQH
jgi:hypothetical protein